MMKETISIINLGPIEEIKDFEIKDINVFIGESASGKSTLMKAINLIYYKIKNELRNDNAYIYDFAHHWDDFDITYKNGTEAYNLKQSKSINISTGEQAILHTDNKDIEFKKDIGEKIFLSESLAFLLDMKELLFEQLLSNTSRSLEENYSDKRFFDLIKLYKNSLDKVDKITDKDLLEILRGQLVKTFDKDFIKFKPNNIEKEINISAISSGQKNILPMAVILEANKDKKNMSLFIEEPESHLFPTDQKKLIEFLVKFAKKTESKLFISTHSPYILACLNNMVLAGEKSSKIVAKEKHIKFANISVNKLENGELFSLMDTENKLIDSDYIDSVSESILEELDSILEE